MTDECHSMARGLSNMHGARVMKLASVWTLAESLFTAMGAQHGADVDPLLSELLECVRARMSDVGVTKKEFAAALQGIQTAGKTAEYLSRIPD